MIASYRDPRYAASIRIAELRERFQDRVPDGVPEELTHIFARRAARTWAGSVAIAGFVGVVLSAIATAGDEPFLHPTLVLAGAVALSLIVYVVTRAVAALTFERHVWSSFDDADDELARLARLEEDSIRRAAVRLAGSGEKASVGLSMAGIALLAPLSIHLVVWCFTGDADIGSERWLRGFDWWIAASLILVGIAHVVLAYQCGRFADKAGEASLRELSRKSPVSGWGALGYTILGACVPGILAFGIPVLTVAVTGLLFIPWMFRHMHRRVVEEREALDAD